MPSGFFCILSRVTRLIILLFRFCSILQLDKNGQAVSSFTLLLMANT